MGAWPSRALVDQVIEYVASYYGPRTDR